ncbi:hypothetical protein VTL71DRAFT_299 [Oculimacula yallundae]|uniref:Uncharacterized protein n=1 Tax=Oculimacula yallundae TaxID=86028 RepID=A0ABR4CZR7_9HELO
MSLLAAVTWRSDGLAANALASMNTGSMPLSHQIFSTPLDWLKYSVESGLLCPALQRCRSAWHARDDGRVGRRMTGVGLDTKPVNHSVHKEWLDLLSDLTVLYSLAGGGRARQASQTDD